MTGQPPPDVVAYCMPGGGGGGGGGTTFPHGAFVVEYRAIVTPPNDGVDARRLEEGPAAPAWTTLRTGALRGGPNMPWKREEWPLPAGKVQVRFSCAGATMDGSNYCALDSVMVAPK